MTFFGTVPERNVDAILVGRINSEFAERVVGRFMAIESETMDRGVEGRVID